MPSLTCAWIRPGDTTLLVLLPMTRDKWESRSRLRPNCNGGRCILCRLALPHRGRSGNPFDLLGDADGPSLGRGTAKSVRRYESTKVPERAGRRFADTVRMADRGRCRREAGQAYALSLTVGRPRERPLPSCHRRRGQTPDRNGAWTERGIGNPPSHGTVFYHRTAEKTRRLPACVRTHASLGRGAVKGDVVSHVDLLILRDRGTRERIVKRKT